MTVIAFRPRPRPHVPADGRPGAPGGDLPGASRPHGPPGGFLRVHRLVIIPRGTFVTGVFTGELRDHDGSLVGVDTRRATIAADLVRQGEGYLPVLRPFQLDLMGITVDVDATTIDPAMAPPAERAHRRPAQQETHTGPRGSSLMRLLALLTPVAMLGALWVLQRLEVWMSHPVGHGRRGSSRGSVRRGTTRSAQRRRRGTDHV